MRKLTQGTVLGRLAGRHGFDQRLSTRRGNRLLERTLARVRGQQTVASALAAGLNSTGNFYMGSGSYIDAAFAWAITIEDRVLIAHDVNIIAHDAAAKRLVGYTKVRRVMIREKAYIGAGSIIMPGVTIGARAIVGAGAVVTHDVEAGTVVVGAPAKPIMSTDSLIERLEQEMTRLPVFEYGPIHEQNPAHTAGQQDALRDALAEHGTIYVR